MEHMDNQITLRGSLLALPWLSHENHGKKFYRFTLEVPRLSVTVDLLPIVAEESILNTMNLSGGEMLTVTGQIRSHNVRTDGIRRLLIFVFATGIVCEDGEPINDVVIQGPLCKEPGPGNLRCDAGSTPGIQPGRLPALYPLGQNRSGGIQLPHPGHHPDLWQASKPHLHQGHGRRLRRADRL